MKKDQILWSWLKFKYNLCVLIKIYLKSNLQHSATIRGRSIFPGGGEGWHLRRFHIWFYITPPPPTEFLRNKSVKPESLSYKDPRHRFHGINSLWEINSAGESILGDFAFMWRVEVGEGEPYWSTHFQRTNNKAAVGREWKVNSCF